MTIILFTVALAGWILIVGAAALLRKPGKPFYGTHLLAQRPSDYLTPLGVLTWTCGLVLFLVSVIALAVRL